MSRADMSALATFAWSQADAQVLHHEGLPNALPPDATTPVQLMEHGDGGLEDEDHADACRPQNSPQLRATLSDTDSAATPPTTARVAFQQTGSTPEADESSPWTIATGLDQHPLALESEQMPHAVEPASALSPASQPTFVPETPVSQFKFGDWALGDRTLSGRTQASGAPSRASSIRYLGGALARSFTHARHVVTGDDLTVHDKWDSWDDDADAEQNEFVARVRASSTSGATSGKVFPQPPQQRELSGVPVADVLQEKGSTRVLLWGYAQALMFSMLVSAVSIPLITVVSLVKWHEDVELQVPATNFSSGAAAEESSGSMTLAPNHAAFQWMLLIQIVFPLIIYAVALFMCIRRTFKIPLLLIAVVVFTLCWSVLACGLFYYYDVAYWFYYIDLLMIVAAYLPCMCVVGWLIDETASIRSRLNDVFFTALLEIIVAAATLIYCLFLMPLFYALTSAWFQMLWLTVLHPLYFEATTGFIVRKILHRNRALGRTHVVYFLSIVHSMVHTVALGTSLQASIEPVRVLALTVFLYNLSKLFWRSTVIQRDVLVERFFKGWSFNYQPEELAELSRMVSVGIITEIILENAAMLITPYLMFRMYKEPIFMAVVPNTFFNNGGTYPPQTLVVLILILFGFTATFDLIFYFLNYHVWQRLPLINTWRRIKKCQGWYLLFLIYGFASMGVLFIFLTMMMLPRAIYCKSNNYCDCSTPGYKTICEGEFNSMSVDYLIEPY